MIESTGHKRTPCSERGEIQTQSQSEERIEGTYNQNSRGDDMDHGTGDQIFRGDFHLSGGANDGGEAIRQPDSDAAEKQNVGVGQSLFQYSAGAPKRTVNQLSAAQENQR